MSCDTSRPLASRIATSIAAQRDQSGEIRRSQRDVECARSQDADQVAVIGSAVRLAATRVDQVAGNGLRGADPGNIAAQRVRFRLEGRAECECAELSGGLR